MHTSPPDHPNRQAALPVFWTGGWESTFRLLDLLVHYHCKVQPIYVIDKQRQSYKQELKTLELIRSEFEEQFPDLAPHLYDLIILERDALPLHEEHQNYFKTLRTVFSVGSQYVWLAAVNSVTGFEHIELSYAADDSKSVMDFVRSNSTKLDYPCGASTYVLDDWNSTNAYEEGMQLFKGFTFPLAHTTTANMEQTAEEYGFANIMAITWSCHRPFRNQPCGVCNYCVKAINAGKVAQFPKSALWRNKYRTIVNPVLVFWNNPRDGFERLAGRLTGKIPPGERP